MQSEHPVNASKSIKRRTSNPASRRMHVEKWKQSGLTMSEYCRKNDVALTSLSAWSQAAKQPTNSFKPVVVTSPQINQAGVIEIVVDNRLKNRLVDMNTQTLVVDIVKELMRCNY